MYTTQEQLALEAFEAEVYDFIEKDEWVSKSFIFRAYDEFRRDHNELTVYVAYPNRYGGFSEYLICYRPCDKMYGYYDGNYTCYSDSIAQAKEDCRKKYYKY